MTGQKFIKTVWTVFEKLQIFIERSGEKMKNQTELFLQSSFFPTPKNKLYVMKFLESISIAHSS